MAAADGLGFFTVTGYGTKTAWVEGIDTGITINGDESQSKNNSTFYPREVTGSSFYLSLVFPTHEEWSDFNEWLMGYGRKLAANQAGPMVVTIGARKFRRIGIPVTGFQYGDESVALARHSLIKFEGTTDPVSPGGAGTSSTPKLPNDSTVRQFYPTGQQASAADRLENALYDAELSQEWSESGYQNMTRERAGLTDDDPFIPGPN